jgi:hypothetical protein
MNWIKFSTYFATRLGWIQFFIYLIAKRNVNGLFWNPRIIISIHLLLPLPFPLPPAASACSARTSCPLPAHLLCPHAPPACPSAAHQAARRPRLSSPRPASGSLSCWFKRWSIMTSKWVAVVCSIWADHLDLNLAGIFSLKDGSNLSYSQTKHL